MAMEYFTPYKKYYDILGNNLTIATKAQTLANTVKESISAIVSTYFNELSESKWEELGKDVTINGVFVGLNSELITLSDFLSDNLCNACDLSVNRLYPTTVEIKNDNEILDKKKALLAQKKAQLAVTPKEITKSYWDEKEQKRIYQDEPNPKYIALSNAIGLLNNEIKILETNLKMYCNLANNIINTILALNLGLKIENINSLILDIPKEESTVEGFEYFTKHLFLGKPYTRWERYGNGFLVTLADGRTFTVYQQTDTNNYSTDNWLNHLRNNIKLNFENDNPLGGGCSGFALASALSYFTNIPYFDPGVAFSGGGQWGGIRNILEGERSFELVDPETGKINYYAIDSDFKLADYSGGNFGNFSTAEKFKEDVHETFSKGGSVILNTTAPGFASPDGQHFVTLMGEDENGYAIIADSMYKGRGANSLNSINYDPNKPYSLDNCPPYMKFNKETGEPFKTDELVDYLVDNAEGTNSYCAISSAALELKEDSTVPSAYRAEYNKLVNEKARENMSATLTTSANQMGNDG